MPDRGGEQVDAQAVADLPNQRWWREHGGDWPAEVARRKQTMPAYHLQEAFLAWYGAACAPARVLEYGCGFGRHLQYLNGISGLDVYGCDQSPTMLEQLLSLPGGERQRGRVCRIHSAAQLPYADRSFDVVLTNSVLIHISPDCLVPILRELVRVCRGHILHLENQPTEETAMTAQDHAGCWKHPILNLYRSIGVRGELLPPPNAIQGCYRVVVGDNDRAPYVPPEMASAFQRLDTAMSGRMSEYQAEIAVRDEAFASLREEVDRNARRLREAQDEAAELRSACDRSERRWRLFLQRLNAAMAGDRR